MMNILNSSKQERREMLELPFQERYNISNQIIKQILKKAKNPIVQNSAGADSCIMSWMIKEIDNSVPNFFADWGLFLPRQFEFFKKFCKEYNLDYYYTHSGFDAKTFFKKYGFPIFKGFKGISKETLQKNYNVTGKCRMLKDRCWSKLRKKYPVDYYFCGLLADENPQRKSLFIQYGFVSSKKDKTTLVKPIILLKKEEVLKFLEENNILYPKDYYQDTYHGKTFSFNHCDLGCYICPNRFHEYGFGRLGRLAREQPKLLRELLDMGLRKTLHNILEDYPIKAQHVIKFLDEYDHKIFNVAYDFDGVLMPMIKREKSIFKQSGEERKLFNRKKRYHFANADVYFSPIEREFNIITARRKKYGDETIEWLTKNEIYPKKISMMDNIALTSKNIINFKLNMLKEMEIDIYYEDDPKIVRAIRKHLPHISVRQVLRNDKNIIVENKVKIGQQRRMW